MVDPEKYKKILDSGLLLDHYFLLISISKGMELLKSKRIQGFYNLLKNKGYIANDELTEKAKLLIKEDIGILSKYTKTVTHTQSAKGAGFSDWMAGIHTKCQDKIQELTGKTQVKSSINGGKGYPFLCNSVDLMKTLTSVIYKYKLKDTDLIEKCLFDHIEECSRKKSWFPIMKYYISKNGESSLATDVLAGGKEPLAGGGKSNQKFV